VVENCKSHLTSTSLRADTVALNTEPSSGGVGAASARVANYTAIPEKEKPQVIAWGFVVAISFPFWQAVAQH